MKLTAAFLSLAGLALAGHAQQPPLANLLASQPDQPDKPKMSQKISSPNRTDSTTWVTSGKRDLSKRHGDMWVPGGKFLYGDKHLHADNAAIKWVDSNGRTMGRAIGNFAILATFDNQLATVIGLGADRLCDANRVCTYASNGARWSEFESVYYTTADCTGIPYSFGGALGTPYLGIPITDSGGTYIYFFKAVDTRRVTLNSRYSTDGCFAIGAKGGFPGDAAPVSEVVPASDYGTPPFFLK